MAGGMPLRLGTAFFAEVRGLWEHIVSAGRGLSGGISFGDGGKWNIPSLAKLPPEVRAPSRLPIGDTPD